MQTRYIFYVFYTRQNRFHKMIIKFVILIVFFMAYHNFKITNANYMLLQIKDQSHNHIVNSKTSKIKGWRFFDAIDKKQIRNTRSRSIGGKFR